MCDKSTDARFNDEMFDDHTRCGCFGRSERLARLKSNISVGWADVVWRTKHFFLRFRPNYRSVFFAPMDIRQPKPQEELSDIIEKGEYRNGVYIGNGYTIFRYAEQLDQIIAEMECRKEESEITIDGSEDVRRGSRGGVNIEPHSMDGCGADDNVSSVQKIETNSDNSIVRPN